MRPIQDPRGGELISPNARDSTFTTATTSTTTTEATNASSFAGAGSIAPSMNGMPLDKNGERFTMKQAKPTKEIDLNDIEDLPNGLDLEQKKRKLQNQIKVLRVLIAISLIALVGLTVVFFVA